MLYTSNLFGIDYILHKVSSVVWYFLYTIQNFLVQIMNEVNFMHLSDNITDKSENMMDYLSKQ